MLLLGLGYFLSLSVLLIYSYGFVDSNLSLSTIPVYEVIQSVLRQFILENRSVSTIVYISIIVVLFFLYITLLRFLKNNIIGIAQVKKLLIITTIFLLNSFPAFSYDLFNYIATAKVTYTWKENPWIVMPIDIPNEPGLAYTRAANKVALYGPTWILLTFFPHTAGMGNIWLTILTFKMLTGIFYGILIILIYKITKSIWQTAYFAFNPLILLEVVLGGHNDIVMLVFAISALILWKKQLMISKVVAIGFWLSSVFVKGATVVLLPLFFLKQQGREHMFLLGYWLMAGVFLLTPIREELYPWYAVWFLSFAVLLPIKKYKLLYDFSLYLSFGLLLRHAPYIYMGYYEAPGPLLRVAATCIPILLFMVVYTKDLVLLIKKILEYLKHMFRSSSLYEKIYHKK